MAPVRVARADARNLARALRSAAMVRSIYEQSKVLDDDRSFGHFVAQNYLGIAAPVSIQVARPADLKKRCQYIFAHEYQPKLARLPRMKPDDFFHWIGGVEIDKQRRLIEIRHRFEQVRIADDRITQNLLTAQRLFVGLETGLLCMVAAIPAAGFLIGASATTIGGSLGVATAWGVGISGVHFVAKTSSELYNTHVIVFDKLKEVLATGFSYAGHVMSEGIGEDGETFAKIQEETERTLHWAGEELAKDPKFAAYMARVEAGVTLKTLSKLGVVCCAGMEIHGLLEQGARDWNAGTAAGKSKE